MFCSKFYLFLLYLWLVEVSAGVSVRKFVHQVDLSEHCRRRVMPSVFLGRHVVEANSQILHFSQLDVPYSCYISIRTESGSNIILTLISQQEGGNFTCDETENQVLVYEFGETFGGYWGPVPDSVLEDTGSDSDIQYTLATRPASTELNSDSYDNFDYEITTTTTTTKPRAKEPSRESSDGDYIRVEMPLMNVSAHLVPSDTMPAKTYDLEESFDIVYDVTPKPGVSYQTSIMPVVQFSIWRQAERRTGEDDGNLTNSDEETDDTIDDSQVPRYQLDYNMVGDLTPDPRLTYSYYRATPTRRNFLTKKYTHHKVPTVEEDVITFLNDTLDDIFTTSTTTESQGYNIEEILKTLLNKTKEESTEHEELRQDSELLRNIADIDHNSSAYLALNWSIFNEINKEQDAERAKKITRTTKGLSSIVSLLFDKDAEDFAGKETTDESTETLIDETPSIDFTRSGRVEVAGATEIDKRSTTEDLDKTDTTTTDNVTTTIPTTAINDSTFDDNINTDLFEEGTFPTETTITTVQEVTSKQMQQKTVSSTKDTIFIAELTTMAPVETARISEASAAEPTKVIARAQTMKSTQTMQPIQQTTPVSYKNPYDDEFYPGRRRLEKENLINDDKPKQVSFTRDITATKVNEVKNASLHASEQSVVKVVPRSGKRHTGKPTPGTTGPMVDHESFENVVQAASVIADILNMSETNPDFEKNKNTKLARQKRYVSVIPIYDARPHNLTNGPIEYTTPEAMYHFGDRQDFAQLVELQDDEIYGHMVLRYMRRYVGAVLFNMCNDRERNVFLFNTSRIVLAINNFTLKRMTIVATPARTLMSAESHCPTSYLECQIKGARVCVDKMVACDGVPNCGADGIYDEDRLTCGGAGKGLQHNVYLAAFTFLAVMMTALYTVYYWLKRCVPKVSDAFFVYTDGTENVLYLDTVMRSPTETDDISKMVPSFYYDNNLLDNYIKNKSTAMSRVGNFLTSCCLLNCFRRKLTVERGSTAAVAPTDSFLSKQMKFYSFPEIELKKIYNPTVHDACVQTGNSLNEMSGTDVDIVNYEKSRVRESSAFSGQPFVETTEALAHRHISGQECLMSKMEEGSLQHTADSELGVVKFFKAARSSLGQLSMMKEARRVSGLPPVDEREICNTEYGFYRARGFSGQNVYDPQASSSIAIQTDSITARPSGQVAKKLRFDEKLRMVSTDEHQDDDDDEPEPEQGGSGREFSKRFFGVGKTKFPTTKKKTTLPFKK